MKAKTEREGEKRHASRNIKTNFRFLPVLWHKNKSRFFRRKAKYKILFPLWVCENSVCFFFQVIPHLALPSC